MTVTPIISNKLFDQLSAQQLLAILQLRQDVFIVEQQSIYTDIDGFDPDCIHFLMENGAKLLGYGRVRQVSRSGLVKLERVVLHPDARGLGWGDRLFGTMLDYALTNFSGLRLELAAQINAQGFYEKFGFQPVGKAFDDGGIMHITMRYRPLTEGQ